jgi:hypothetical protein
MLVAGTGRPAAATRPAHDVSGGRPFDWQILTLPPAAGGHRTSFGEPGIAVGSHRELVVDAARANVGYPTWWISSDGGRRWGSGRDFDTTGAMTGDADVAFGPDGSLYVLNLAFQNPPQQPTNPTVLVYSSRDRRRWRGPATFPRLTEQTSPTGPGSFPTRTGPVASW